MCGIKVIFVRTKRTNTFRIRAQLLAETSLGITFQTAHCFLSSDPLFSDTTFCGIYLVVFGIWHFTDKTLPYKHIHWVTLQ